MLSPATRSTKDYSEFNIHRIVLGFILLSIGGLIYLLFRPDSLVLFRFIDCINLSNFVAHIREFSSNASIPDFYIYALPDGLWITSYILIMTGIWTFPDVKQIAFCSLLPAIGLITEVGQYLRLVKGTPDYADAICYITPFLIYVLIRKHN